MSKLCCYSCQSSQLKPIISFGRTTLADALLTKEQLDQPEYRANLELVFCEECSLVQITESVPPEILFCQDYPYYSSVSPSLLAHFRQSAESIICDRKLTSNSLVIEAASNDGYMLKNFCEKGISVLGIDPAEGPAKVAQQKGIPTRCTFFGRELAQRLKTEGYEADVFLANNVLAHVPDLNGFVSSIAMLLKDQGVAVIEVPYLVNLIEHCEFDTIYHQHLCYFSVTALDRLFRRHNLFLNAIQKLSIHGGSLRLFVEPNEAVKSSVTELLTQENRIHVDSFDYYLNFANRVNKIRTTLLEILKGLKTQGKQIVGYGAAAKATTLLS
ncbi:MAG: class I SAM-dependent methyltransferase, partial [Cyanobacteria bacterium P01_H01_bin.15]